LQRTVTKAEDDQSEILAKILQHLHHGREGYHKLTHLKRIIAHQQDAHYLSVASDITTKQSLHEERDG